MLTFLKHINVLRPLSAKFKPPVTGAYLVPRQHIAERIRQAGGAKLILVQAPPGFGKTTLLRHTYDLFAAQQYQVAWLTLEAGDNDLELFTASLACAFDEMKGSTAVSVELERPQEALPDTNNVLGLIDSLAEITQPFLLVLDEFEYLHNPAALSVLQQIIEMLRPGQKIMLASREQPKLSLGRLRARQQLLEINAAQLRFTCEETAEFLRNKRNLKLDDQDVEKLQKITDGWVGALWLSSLALEGASEPKRVLQSFSGSNKVIASYLAEDVLSHKSQTLQDFIMQTSILQQFCAESCRAVTGREDSRELLEEIERSNLFMTPMDEQQVWFSYHPLFAEFLRSQLQRQHPDSVTTLHRRAALWYVEQKRPVRAIDHALASGDQELVVQLLNEYAEALLLQGRVRLLARWLDALDRRVLLANSKLVYVYSWVLIHINRSNEALNLLEAITGGGAETRVLSHRTYLVLKTFALAMLDRIDETGPAWQDPQIQESAAGEPLLRSMLLIGCAYYYAAVDRYQEARQMLDAATKVQPEVGPLFSVTIAGYIQSMLDLMQGNLRSAAARLRTLIVDSSHHAAAAPKMHFGVLMGFDPGGGHTERQSDSGFASLYLAEALYEMDLMDEAKRLLKIYLPLIKETGLPDQIITGHIIYARILRSEGHANDALQVLLDLEQLGLQRGLLRIIDMARLERARGAILEGDLASARAILDLVGIAPPWQRPDLHLITDDLDTPLLAMCRLQVHSGHADAALPLLKEQMKEAFRRGRMRFAFKVKALYALALAQGGQRNQALRTLREVLQEAQTEGFIRLFKEEGPALLALVREMLAGIKDVMTPENSYLRFFAERVINIGISAKLSLHPDAADDSASIVHGSELTSRELDVLRLLAKGNGNQAIAEKLFVSITTVRTHLRNINIKLEAHNRTEAIAIARQRSILM